MSKRRALFLTSQLFAFAGSELTVFELAKELLARGWQCEICAAVLGSPLGLQVYSENIDVTLLQGKIDVSDFDLVWCQHGTIASIDYTNLLGSRRPLLISVHLSPYSEIEKVLHPYEQELTDLIVVNSEETRQSLPAGIGTDVLVSNNPAPAAFFGTRTHSEDIRNILCVTNHLAAELSHVFLHFQRNLGVTVRRLGFGAEMCQVRPRDIFESDCVIAIGKSVQYALASRTPVYVYDHFGGDGWVTGNNLNQMSAFNFSGRPNRRRLSSEEIFVELTNGYQHAVVEMRNLSEAKIAAFDLRKFVDMLVDRCEIHKKDIHISAFDSKLIESIERYNDMYYSLYRKKYRNLGVSIWSTPSLETYFGG